MSTNEPQPSLEKIKQALQEISSAEEPSLRTIFLLVDAGVTHGRLFVPQLIQDSVLGVWSTKETIENGGIDQCVWNIGPEESLTLSQNFRELGAIENAQLFEHLSYELVRFRYEMGDELIKQDNVAAFLQWRRQVKGPFFTVPDLQEEVGLAMIEYVARHKNEFPTF